MSVYQTGPTMNGPKYLMPQTGPPMYQPMYPGYAAPAPAPAAAPVSQQVSNNTNIVIQQPGADNVKPWDAKLCGCMDNCAICWMVLLCPFCYLCNLSTRMNEGCIMPLCVWPPSAAIMSLRIKLRSKQNIQGSIIKDCCLSCCPCTVLCALCQVARQFDRIIKTKGAFMY